MRQQVLSIPDMHCSNCVIRLEGLEDDLPGVQRVQASYRKQQMVIDYDETRLSLEQIVAAIKALGYQVAGL
ncbi:MAG: cation transporter [Anaerolineales bacterium]|jgi:copper chaperone CopZ|nr:cation transporter [Anaerolineales bacterium]